ncbi:MAG: phosphopentomutase, partial [Eubacteriales bacterium]|nr:phosphopentomutase [Eubacteriales bacterium]
AKALTEFDIWLANFIKKLQTDDILIITADHGCDPGYTQSTDHTREYVPLIIYGNKIKSINLSTREGFCDIGKTICDYLHVENNISGESFLEDIYE